jgi:hypothetical protein
MINSPSLAEDTGIRSLVPWLQNFKGANACIRDFVWGKQLLLEGPSDARNTHIAKVESESSVSGHARATPQEC